MNKIGTIENNYQVYQQDNKTFLIQFETENHTIGFDDFKWIEETSYETTNYHAKLVIDGKVVGSCHNEGRGGCSNYHLNDTNNKELLTSAINDVEKTENYCIPHRILNFEDVLDTLSCYYSSFDGVKTKKSALHIIKLHNEQADGCRKIFTITNK